MKYKVVILAFMLVQLSTYAQFEWKYTQLTFNKSELQSQLITGQFPFQNKGKKSIELVKLESSCGCTTMDLQQKSFSSQETGVIPFEVSLKDKKKTFTSRIYVTTNEDSTKKETLTIKVIYPEDKQKQNIAASDTGTNKSLKEGADDPKVVKRQVSCPFQGTPILKNLYVDTDEGHRIYTCCEECLPLVKANPALAIQNLAERGEFPIYVSDIEALPKEKKVIDLEPSLIAYISLATDLDNKDSKENDIPLFAHKVKSEGENKFYFEGVKRHSKTGNYNLDLAFWHKLDSSRLPHWFHYNPRLDWLKKIKKVEPIDTGVIREKNEGLTLYTFPIFQIDGKTKALKVRLAKDLKVLQDSIEVSKKYKLPLKRLWQFYELRNKPDKK